MPLKMKLENPYPNASVTLWFVTWFSTLADATGSRPNLMLTRRQRRFAAPTRPQRQITSNGVIAVIMAQDGTIFTAHLGTALDDP